jgi:hypothetical protein
MVFVMPLWSADEGRVEWEVVLTIESSTKSDVLTRHGLLAIDARPTCIDWLLQRFYTTFSRTMRVV